MRAVPIFCAAVVLGLSACGDSGAATREHVPPVAAVRGDAPSAETFQSVVAAVLPAIVYVEAEGRPERPRGGLVPGSPGSQNLLPLGSGSGVIYTPEGLILTNNHVVQDAQRVLVTLYDRRQFEARVLARDPATDVAVLQIEGSGFPTAPLGDSDGLALGDWVLALGSPLGLEFTVTAGIVSGTGRSLGILGRGNREQGQAAPLEHFIQTDAAINPGNSGGPLVNLAGEVIGINTAIASPTGVFAGYGFAIPSNLAWRVADQLVQFGEVRRPYLGVLLDNITAADAEVYGLEIPEGAEVKYLEPDGPAERAGLELGDVIVAVEGRRVRTVSDLQAHLAQLEPGSIATVAAIRYGEAFEAGVQLGVIRSGVASGPPAGATLVSEGREAGIGFTTAERGGMLVVAGVQPYSPAVRAGVRPGQVILRANRAEVRTRADLERVIEASGGSLVSLIVEDPNVGRTIVNYRI
jgi:serine protease Do